MSAIDWFAFWWLLGLGVIGFGVAWFSVPAKPGRAPSAADALGPADDLTTGIDEAVASLRHAEQLLVEVGQSIALSASERQRSIH